MGVEEIVRLIEREATDEAVQLVAAANAKASTLRDEAEASVQARVAAARDRAEPVIAASATRRINVARLRLLGRRAAVAARQVDDVMSAADTRLRSIADGADEDRWAASLQRQARAAMDWIGPGGVVVVRKADARLVAGVVADAGGRLQPNDDPAAPAGLTARTPDGRLAIDATLAARLERARGRYAEEVGQVLGRAE